MGLGQGSAKRLSEWSVSAAQFPCRPLSTASYDGGIAQLIQTEIGVETPTGRRRKDTHTELEEERHTRLHGGIQPMMMMRCALIVVRQHCSLGGI